jgi:hypothetical protein
MQAEWKKATDNKLGVELTLGVPAFHELVSDVPRYLADKFIRAKKRSARRKARKIKEQKRVSMNVLKAGVVVALDAKHLGDGIKSHNIRDRGSLRYELAVVERGMKAEEFTKVVELQMKREGPPLVIQTDNDPIYRANCFKKMFEKLRVIPMYSLPRTPQHNPVAEQGMKEVTAYLPLEGAPSPDEAFMIVKNGLNELNTKRRRPSRNGLTANEWHDTHRVEFNREKCYREYDMLKSLFRLDAGKGKRAQRMADRRAVITMLVNNGLATVSTGPRPPRSASNGKG